MASEQPCLANSLNCFNKDFYYLGEQQADIQSDIYLCVEAQSSNVNGEFGVDSGPPRRLHSFLSCRKLVTVIAAAAFQLLPICFISSASPPCLLACFFACLFLDCFSASWFRSPSNNFFLSIGQDHKMVVFFLSKLHMYRYIM